MVGKADLSWEKLIYWQLKLIWIVRNKQNKMTNITAITSPPFPRFNLTPYSRLIYSCDVIEWEMENEGCGQYLSVCFCCSFLFILFLWSSMDSQWASLSFTKYPLSPNLRTSFTSCSDVGVLSAVSPPWVIFFYSLLCLSIIFVVYLICLPIGDTSLAAGSCHESAGGVWHHLCRA